MCIYIHIHTHTHLSLCVCFCLYVCVRVSVCVCLCLSLCLRLCLFLCACVRARVSLFLSPPMCVCARSCLSLSLPLYVRRVSLSPSLSSRPPRPDSKPRTPQSLCRPVGLESERASHELGLRQPKQGDIPGGTPLIARLLHPYKLNRKSPSRQTKLAYSTGHRTYHNVGRLLFLGSPWHWALFKQDPWNISHLLCSLRFAGLASQSVIHRVATGIASVRASAPKLTCGVV